MSNPYGDVELDAQGMRALAHPTRLAILLRLRQRGPSTATALAPDVGASPSVTSWHLRHLARHGLVHDAEQQGSGRERWWEAVTGFRFAATDEAGQDAARLLSQVIEQVEGDLVGAWRAEVEPHLEPEWRALVRRANTTVLVTREELERLEGDLEELLAPYVLRKDADPDEVPDGARLVRLIQHTLPGLAHGEAADA